MSSIRTTIAALTMIMALAASAASSPAAAQSPSFSRCPKTAEQFGEVMKVLVTQTERARTMAEDNPLLLADVGFYEAELKATKQCAPAVAAIAPVTR